MAIGSIVKGGSKLFTKIAPKVAEKGFKELAGKGGKELAEGIFKQIGDGSADAGKKIFGELAKKALKGDKDAIAILKTMGKDIMDIPGLGKDAAGLALKTLVNSTIGGGGDMVRNLFGLTGNAANALKPPKKNELNPD